MPITLVLLIIITPVYHRNLPAQVSMQDYTLSPNQVIQDFICQQLLK